MDNEKEPRKQPRNRLENLKPIPFTKDNQPSPEKKKAGRERKREAQKIMERIMEGMDMEYDEIMMKYFTFDEKGKVTLRRDIPIKHLITAKYLHWVLTDPKMMQDWLNRHVSYAPTKQEHTGNDGTPLVIKVGQKSKEEEQEDEEE